MPPRSPLVEKEIPFGTMAPITLKTLPAKRTIKSSPARSSRRTEKGEEWIGVLRTRILRGSGNRLTGPKTSLGGMSLDRFPELHPVPVKGWLAAAPAQQPPKGQIVQLQEEPRCPWCLWCGYVGFVRGLAVFERGARLGGSGG